MSRRVTSVTIRRGLVRQVTAANACSTYPMNKKESLSIRIFVEGPRAAELEEAVRAALGPRPDEEVWLVSVVKLRFMWGVTVLASPLERLQDWTFFGPRDAIGRVLSEAVRSAAAPPAPEPRPATGTVPASSIPRKRVGSIEPEPGGTP